jgi:hypothetical protein
MRTLDRILSWFLVVLGCAHNFIAAPLKYQTLSLQALWFVSAGLALWYAGFLNVLRTRSASPDRFLSVLCVLTNVSLLVFVIAFAAVMGNWTSAGAIALIVSVALLTGMSVVALKNHFFANRPLPGD